MRKAMLAAVVLALAGCAGHGTHEGMSWQDGSWYSPAHDGHGDYYTANPRRPPDAWDVPWAWSVGFVPYGGFCPAAYRYCTSFWADPWYSAAWDPWYYPFAYVPPRHRLHPPPPMTMSNLDEDSPGPRQTPDGRRFPSGNGRPGMGPGSGGGRGTGAAPHVQRRRDAAEGGRD